MPTDTLRDLTAAGAQVTVILRGPAFTVPPATVVVVRSPRAAVEWIDDLASRSVVGRVIRRLTPLDPGSTFWRSTRRSAAARESLRKADLVVALERDATYAAWRWVRAERSSGLRAVYGAIAARAAVAGA